MEPNHYTQLPGEFGPTFYRILDEAADEWNRGEAASEAIKSRNGEVIAHVTPSFKHQLEIEGSARLRDGRIVNFEHKRDGEWHFMVAKNAPYGLGEHGYKLIPEHHKKRGDDAENSNVGRDAELS
jgi:hypothetical protein